MSKVRRNVGAFILATVVATGIILTPTAAHASGLGSDCSIVAKAIGYLESQPSGRIVDAVLAKLRDFQAAHCA